MKRLKLGSKTLNIKSDSLGQLIDCSLSLKELTRANVSKRGGVSLATAGKLLSALDECRITKLEYKRDSGAGSPSRIHTFRNEIGVLVLDLSSPTYSASIIFGKDRKFMSESYQYDPTLSFEGNATVFLSKIGQKTSLLPYSASVICTIIADTPESAPKISHASAYLPCRSETEIVNELCAQFFGTMPALCLTYSEATACALKYNLFEPTFGGESISHIRLSDTLSATHLPRASAPMPLNLSKMMASGKSLPALLEKVQDSNDMASVLSHLISLISCAYESDLIIIEYDSERWSGIEERIAQLFRAAGISMPEVAYYDLSPQAAVIGGATEALSLLIKSQVKGV